MGRPGEPAPKKAFVPGGMVIAGTEVAMYRATAICGLRGILNRGRGDLAGHCYPGVPGHCGMTAG